MRHLALWTLASVFLCGHCPALAGTIRVPGNQPTIQAGVNAAGTGDTVLVACGSYYEYDIALKSGVVLLSECGEPNCVIIDARGDGMVFYCDGVDSSTKVVGLTVSMGFAPAGGGMYCRRSSPTLERCTFSWNRGTWGGAIYCTLDSSPSLIDCKFWRNSADWGGGIYCSGGSSVSLVGCEFAENFGLSGGGVRCALRSAATLDRCTFFRNIARQGGGINCSNDAAVTLTNCTFYRNRADGGAGVLVSGTHVILENTIVAFGIWGGAVTCGRHGSATLTCCDLYGNEGGDWVSCIADQYGVSGNISENPLLCDPEGGDCRLDWNSPCAPGNSPEGCGLIGALPVGCGVVEATVDVDPNALNLRSKGEYVTCYIELPEGYDPGDIDVGTVTLNHVIEAESHPTSVGDYDMDGIADRMVKFSRKQLIAHLAGIEGSSLWLTEKSNEAPPIQHGDEFEVVVSGQLADGTPVSGTDVIDVINPVGGAGGGTGGGTATVKVYPPSVGHTARISYELRADGHVNLCIFDAVGRLVRTLETDNKAAGAHTVNWDGRTDGGVEASSGLYFIRLEQRGVANVQKLLILK